MARVYAYIDESGNHDLDIDKDGVSKYFVVLAIIIKSEDLDAVRQQAEELRGRHFQAGEIKSNNVRDKDGHQRRVKILNEIQKLKFKFFAVAVDKSAVMKDGGLRYKKPFFKFINGLLYKQLFQNFIDISIVADAHGNQEFFEEFKKYIDDYHKPDLFWQSQIEMVESKSDVLIQLADFVVGSITKVYTGKSNSILDQAYQVLMQEKALHIHEWPTKYQTYYPPTYGEGEFDQFIYSHSMAQAEVFLNANEDAFDENTKLQFSVLRYLVFISRFDIQRGYVGTQEILLHLTELGFANVTELAIRSKIVAKLRDNGVLISSCNRGYKIPCSYKDLIDFAERVNGLVIPLIDRLKKARASFLIASHGEVDFLNEQNFPELASFISQLEK